MKKVLILVLLLISICGCNKTKKVSDPIKDKVPVLKENSYIDENPVVISLYVDNFTGGMDKVIDLHEKWVQKKDICVLGAVFTDEDSLAADYYQKMWKKYAEKYEDYNKYRIGWYLRFSLIDGTVFEKYISHPDDVNSFYDYLEIYLYDDINQELGAWYSHLTAINDDTILSAMKITAGSKYAEVVSPIEVMVYTSDSIDDFDDNNMYRGKSFYKIKVYND